MNTNPAAITTGNGAPATFNGYLPSAFATLQAQLDASHALLLKVLHGGAAPGDTMESVLELLVQHGVIRNVFDSADPVMLQDESPALFRALSSTPGAKSLVDERARRITAERTHAGTDLDAGFECDEVIEHQPTDWSAA